MVLTVPPSIACFAAPKSMAELSCNPHNAAAIESCIPHSNV
jgi:hypothetical protein